MVHLRRRLGLVALVLFAVVSSTAPAVAVDASDEARFIWPTTGRISQPYGCTGFRMEPRYGSCRHFHGGIDIANSRGTRIQAAGDGVVYHVGWDPWGTRNWMVMINHGDGIRTRYAHMQNRKVAGIHEGVRVRQGQLIGYMGTTGMSTGPHLHWAVLVDGVYANPSRFVDGRPTRSPRRGRGGTTGPTTCRITIAAVEPGAATARVLEGNEPATCAA